MRQGGCNFRCGVVAYLRKKEAQPLLLEGLSRLIGRLRRNNVRKCDSYAYNALPNVG
jgi:hypothetical protein